MSYPSIFPTMNPGYDCGSNPQGEYVVEYGGALYALLFQDSAGNSLHDVGDKQIHAFKSTDKGQTWTDIAQLAYTYNSSPPPYYPTNEWMVWTACRDGSNWYVMDMWASWTGVDTDPVVWDGAGVTIFDLDAETFGTRALHTEVVGGSSTAGSNAAFQTTCRLVRRGSGDMLLVYNGPHEVIGPGEWPRIYVVTWDGTSFGTPFLAEGPDPFDKQTGDPSQYVVTSAFVEPATGILHIAFIYELNQYWHIALDASNIGGHMQLLENSPAGGGNAGNDNQGERSSNFCILGSNVAFTQATFVQFTGSPNGDPTIYYAPSGILSPTWSKTVISTSGSYIDQTFEPGTRTMQLFVVAGAMHCIWTACDLTGDDTPAVPPNGRYLESTSTDLITWTPEVLVFAQTDGYFNSSQCLAYPFLDGSVGILGLGFVGATDNAGGHGPTDELGNFFCYAVSIIGNIFTYPSSMTGKGGANRFD